MPLDWACLATSKAPPSIAVLCTTLQPRSMMLPAKALAPPPPIPALRQSRFSNFCNVHLRAWAMSHDRSG